MIFPNQLGQVLGWYKLTNGQFKIPCFQAGSSLLDCDVDESAEEEGCAGGIRSGGAAGNGGGEPGLCEARPDALQTAC